MILIISISVQVVCSAFSINPLFTFTEQLPFIGKAITLNSLLDFQWHLLVMIGLIPAGLVWLKDKHVRVDFFYEKRSDRSKSMINLVGNFVFALPFFYLMLPSAVDFAQRAWRSDEGSRNNGLEDLWLIKSILPFGLALLACAIALETVSTLRRSLKSNRSE